MVPRVMTSTRSATDKALWMCCSTSRTAVPSSAAARTARNKRSTMSGARPSDSSSTSSSRHWRARHRASASICCWPPDRRPTRRSRCGFELREQRQRAVDVAPADAQVLARGEVHQHGALLRHHAEALPGAHVQRRVGARAEEAHLAAEGAQLARERRDRRRLARRRSARATRPPRPRRRAGGGRARSRRFRIRRAGRRPRGRRSCRRPVAVRPVAGWSRRWCRGRPRSRARRG